MSAEAVETVLRRAQEDAGYRRLLAEDPDRALHGYDISYAERQALVAGDVTKLEQLGVSPELSRMAGEYNREGDRIE